MQSRQDCWSSQRINTLNLKQTKQAIKEKLYSMSIEESFQDNESFEDEIFDFRFITWNPSDQGMNRYRRTCQFYYECKSTEKNCHPFTSSIGTAQFVFNIQPLTNFFVKHPKYTQPRNKLKNLRYPFILKWNLYFYRMKCKYCKKDATPFLSQQQLQQFIKRIKQIIKDILLSNKQPEDLQQVGHGSRRKKLKGHKKMLCEACKRNVCRYKAKKQ